MRSTRNIKMVILLKSKYFKRMIFDIFPLAYGPMAVTWFRQIEKHFQKRLIMLVTFRDSLIAYYIDCCKNECHFAKKQTNYVSSSNSPSYIRQLIICKYLFSNINVVHNLCSYSLRNLRMANLTFMTDI